MPTITEIRAQYPQYADVPDEKLLIGLHRKFYSDMPFAQFHKNIVYDDPPNPTEGMTGTQKFLSGAGKAYADIGRGAKQLVSSDAPTMSGLITGDRRSQIQQDIDEAKKRDAALMKTGAGMTGNIVGNAAIYAPAAFIPGANTYVGAGLLGGAMGALQPVATGESRLLNTGMGAGAGVIGQGVGNAIGRAISPVTSRLGPEEQALAQAAGKEGIPLTAGQATGSKPLQIAESVLENLPFTSAPQLAGKETQQRAFTAAALRRAGIAGDAATPEALAGQKAALGGTLGNIAKSNVLDFYRPNGNAQGPLIGQLDQILKEAEKRGTTASEPVRQVVMNIVGDLGEGSNRTALSGQNYQAWRQTLRPLASGGGADAHLYGQIRSALDNAFNSQMEGAGSEAWKTANRQYANLKTIMQAAGGPGSAAATNQIAPAQLSAALRQAIGKEGVALGRGDMNDLSRIGTTFVKDQIPNSGTAQRQFVQSLLTGGGGAGIGAAAGAGTAAGRGESPWTGAGEGALAGAGVGAASLIAPRLAQALMNSSVGQAYLKNGVMTPAAREALSAWLRTAAIGSAPALEAAR